MDWISLIAAGAVLEILGIVSSWLSADAQTTAPVFAHDRPNYATIIRNVNRTV
jgi:hypothetical protein